MASLSVITASSNSGSSCLRELLTRYKDSFASVTAAFRSESSAEKLKSASFFDDSKVKIVVGVDASKPETLPVAFEGTSVSLIVTPLDHAKGMENDAELTANMIHAAVNAGVKHIVYVGSWTVDAPAEVSIISSRFVATEKLLQELHDTKQIKYTILRGGYFTLNFGHIFANSIKQSSKIVLPQGFAVPPCHTDAIGITAAAVFANPSQHENKIYRINGPEVVDGKKIAETFTKVLGREISLTEVPVENYIANAPPYAKELMLYLTAKGENAIDRGDGDDVTRVAGRNFSLEYWLEENKALFA